MEPRRYRFAMLAGSSAIGKSTDAARIATELGCGLLCNDEEIACRTFKLLHCEQHCAEIGIPERWAHLYGRCDLDRLFRLAYRDWIARNPECINALAEGWLYGLPRHRQ
jgi:hypothetical protein